MSKATVQKTTQSIDDLPPLPEVVVTKGGSYRFSTSNKTRWSIQATTQKSLLNFERAGNLSDQMLHALKLVLIWYFQNKSPNHAANIFERMVMLFRFLNKSDPKRTIDQITSADILSYKAAIKRQEHLSGLTGALKKWHGLGYPGIADDVVKLLGRLRLKGNPKGEAVLTMDPKKGPYTELEIQAILAAANKAYLEGQLALDDHLLIWLVIALGARPVQYATLKLKDYEQHKTGDNDLLHVIKIPLAKQRDQMIRDGFLSKRLIPEIADLVAKQIKAVTSSMSEFVDDPQELPLFPYTAIDNQISGYAYHHNGQRLSTKLKKALQGLNIISHRTGAKLTVNARRFRYTIGTNAARDGHGELEIAELLGHSDTQNVGVYIKAVPEMLERIDKAMALQMAPMAQAFLGMLVEDESQAERGNDPASRIIGPHILRRHEPIGNCGKYGFCGFGAPIACYTCIKFQPWLDGPHEEVLEFLLAERDRHQEQGMDLRISSVNDMTIMAVAEVVTKCRQIKQQEEQCRP